MPKVIAYVRFAHFDCETKSQRKSLACTRNSGAIEEGYGRFITPPANDILDIAKVMIMQDVCVLPLTMENVEQFVAVVEENGKIVGFDAEGNSDKDKKTGGFLLPRLIVLLRSL